MRTSAFLLGLLLGVGVLPLVGGASVGAREAPTTMPSPLVDGLDITAPAAVNLGSGFTGATISGSLGQVVVEDFRGPVNPNAWTATVSATAFVTGAGGPSRTIAAGQVRYWSGPVVQSTGGGTLLPGQPTAAQAVTLDAPRVAFRKTTGNGNNRVRWSPTLRITVPNGVVSGAYRGTVVHSVA